MSSRSVLAAVLAVAVVFGSSAVTAPASATTYLEGVDVSHWQGTIDWTKVAGAGKAFAMMKATDGETFVDSMYSTNHAGARAAGVRVGAYHFAEPSSTAAEAIVQADWFVNHIGYLPGDLVPALDLEVTDGLSASQLQAWVGYWLNEVTAKLGIKPMIYTSPSFWRTYMGDTAAFANQGYTVLWVAHWFVTTPSVPANNWGGHSWTFWQYTNCGTVSGISGCVDLDRYNGTDFTPVTYKADFRVATSPSSRSVRQGAGTSYGVTVSTTYFTLPIALSVAGLPAGVTAAISPTSLGSSAPSATLAATVTVATSKSGTITPVGSYALTITAVGGGTTRKATVGLVVTDGIASTVVAPASRVYAVTTLGGTTTVPVTTYWSATDPSGIASYTLERLLSGGAWTVQSLASATTTSVVQSLSFGSTYRYVVKATDGAGNTSSWVYGTYFSPQLSQETSSAIAYSGTWTSVATSYASGGTLKSSTAAGASATYTFSGASVAWVGYRGPNRGSASVYLDGVLRATVNLYAAAWYSKQIVYTANWGVNGTHTIKIVNLATSGHPQIDVDAFVRLVQS